MKIALFGGTFDPIHNGHLQAAQAAARHFRLDKILFIPSGNPPHKFEGLLTPFPHRFAMVSLACAGNPQFVPSLLESPRPDGHLHYSVDTVRLARKMAAKTDKLYFLVGLDAFLDLPQWRHYRELLGLVDFLVVSRPGFQIEDTLKVIPRSILLDNGRKLRKDSIRLKHSTLHLLTGVDIPTASREIRKALESRKPVGGFLPPTVEEYIVKEQVYGRKAGSLKLK